MRILVVILTAMLALAGEGDAFAKKKKRKKRKKKKKPAAEYVMPYGMAGCGLGSMFFKSNDFMQVFASSTNATAYQSFAITSGTSNCVPSGEKMALEQKVFVDANLAMLQTEAAQGQGETLAAFAELLGCNHEDFAKFSQSNFAQLYQVSSPKEVLARHHRSLGNRCDRTSI